MKPEFKKIESNLLIKDFSDYNIDSSFINEHIQQITKDINRKKDGLFIEKLKEITGIEIDIEKESKRRFKRFFVDYSEGKETIYYNDGSDTGIRIITFIMNENHLDFKSNKINFGFDYY